jgi:hypothetical protein
MNKMRAILILLTTVFFTSCKNDVEINGEWKDISVVFGLLNQSDTAHYVRISKAFLGEGDALVFAKQFDSLYYQPELLEVTVTELINGNQTRVFNLVADQTIPKEEGIFASPGQILYKFQTPPGSPLKSEAVYALTIKKVNTGELVTAETGLVESFFLSSPISILGYSIYPRQKTTVKWTAPVNGKLFEVFIRFLYREYPEGSPSEEVKKFVEINLGRITANNTLTLSEKQAGETGEELQKVVQNIDLYRALSVNIQPSSISNPKLRFADSLLVIVNAADDDLNTYLEVNKPSNTIAQERPQFTNIQNGIGLFASRTVVTRRLYINDNSVDSLRGNTLTSAINFQQR